MPKIIKKLADTEVRKAKPRQKPYKLCDEGGLRLLVRPTGAKVWQYPYTLHGKHNTYTIGQYWPEERAGYYSLAEARKVRDQVKAMIQQGLDPNRHKLRLRSASEEASKTSFEAIAREWHGKGTWVEKHAKNILKALEDDVFPLIGQKQIDKVSTQDVIAVITAVEKRGALDVAKRICQRCEAIFDYGIVKGVCENNPASGRVKFVQGYKVKHRPHLKEHEYGEFLAKLDDYHGKDYIRLAMRLLTMTFVRPGELRGTKWSEIDMQNALWRIPAERMKMERDHVVPLSKQALHILRELKTLTGHSDYVFPGIRSPHKPISDVTLLKLIQLLGYKGDNKIVPHGFRHTASTILNEQRYNRDVIERQLAHIDKDKTRSIYNHAEYLTERTSMMQDYADHLDKLKGEYLAKRA